MERDIALDREIAAFAASHHGHITSKQRLTGGGCLDYGSRSETK